MIMPRIENGVIIPININPNNILGPYIWSFHANSGLFFEIMFPNIWEPSSGETGNILNIAKARLIYINK